MGHLGAGQLANAGLVIIDFRDRRGLISFVAPADHQDFAVGERHGRAVIAAIGEIEIRVAVLSVADLLLLVVEDEDVLATGQGAIALFAIMVAAHDDHIAGLRIDRHVRAEDVRARRVRQRAMDAGFRVPEVVDELSALHALLGRSEGQHLSIGKNDRMQRNDRPGEDGAPFAIAINIADVGLNHVVASESKEYFERILRGRRKQFVPDSKSIINI